MEEDNLLNVCASKFINESGLRDVGAYDNKPHGDWNRKLVDIDSANHLIFEWYYRGEPIAKTVDSEWVTDNPAVRALIISKAKEMMKELLNKNIMEEKKTKKMTKAEAFEYLKGKKVILRTEDEQVELQRFLFNVGYQWLSGRNVMKLYSDIACMFFLDEGGLITHSEYDQESDKLFCDTHVYKETKLDDILSIEIIEEKKEKFVDCSEPCDEIKAVQELLRNSKHLKGKTLVITKDNAAIL